MYMVETTLDSLRALDLSSFLLNGYQVFCPGERRQNMKMSAQQPDLHPQKQKYTTTQVKPSWHVDKASLHIDIIIFLQNEPGNRTATFTQVTLYQPAKTTLIFFCIYQEEHWACFGHWTTGDESARSAPPRPPPKAEVYRNPCQDFVAWRQSFSPY